MLCVLDIDTTDQKTAARAVCALLEVAMPRARREVATKAVPQLYKSGVRYQAQSPAACCFRQPSEVLARAGGDCKQLVLWRIAELREAGEHATPRVLWLTYKQGLQAHMQLRRKDGTIEDPSVCLGMVKP